MIDTKNLLTDDQMRRFISDGYLILNADFPAEFHQNLQTQIETVMDKEGNPGNNFLPRFPEAQEVFKHPTIKGALTSVLGPNHIMHPHRHCHFSKPGRTVQRWHKDSYWGYQKVRNHHNWWAMIFYYPQETVMDMGPSGILPGSQYLSKRASEELEKELYMTGDAGTFALIQYDLWHKGTANVSKRNRSMMKFQFVRMDAPSEPAWNNGSTEWIGPNGDGPPTTQETAWQHHWNWHLGNQGSAPVSRHLNGEAAGLINALGSESAVERMNAADTLGLAGDGAADAIPALIDALKDREEPVAVNASYALAAMGEAAIPALMDALRTTNKSATRNAGYALSNIGSPAFTPLVDALSSDNELTRGYAAFALGELTSDAKEAVPALNKLADDSSDWVRRNMVEALGTIDSAEGVSTLANAVVNDSDDQARFTAALSLTRLGEKADAAVPALTEALKDENRYVRANAVEALRRIGSKEATDAVIDYLSASRWCSTTTPDNTF